MAMSLSDNIASLWYQTSFDIPSVYLLYSDGTYFAVIEDDTSIIRMMDQNGRIYATLRKRCRLAKPDISVGDKVYVCDKVTPILCSHGEGPGNEKDRFVFDNIAISL